VQGRAHPDVQPHDLRHRRISLLHLEACPGRGSASSSGSAACSVTADVYSHVLSDETEVDYAALL
jgi:hypothetical protein